MVNNPKIRFAGFSDEWVQRKLGDFLSIPEKIRADVNESSDLMTLKLNLGGIRMGANRETLEIGATIYYERKAGQFIYGKQNFFNGSMAIIPPELDGKATSGDVPSLDISGINPNYFYTYVSRMDYWKSKEAAASGTGSKRIHEATLFGFDISEPGLKEQQKLGSIFATLDHKIGLEERQISLLKDLKKGYLQKMFPKQGATEPEIRFVGFADDWEQCKLEEISDKVTEKNKNSEFVETLTNSAEFGIINQRDFFDKNISNEKNLNGYYIVREDDFVYNPRISNYAPVGPIKRNKLGRTGVMSPLYYVFRPYNIDKKFLEYYFDTTVWHKFMKINGNSGARADRFAIKDSIFKTMPIPYPSIEEQRKIGKFFDNLNDTITLHQRKLDLLKDLKKGLSQQMFV